MAVLKSYTCSKCAGVLMFDPDQDFFDCPFCGTKFESLDFHAGEVLEQARSLHQKGSFDAAREKYKAYLESEPGNFESLLGSVLCDIRITSPEELEMPDMLPSFNPARVRRSILNAKENSDKNGALYFGKMLELINIREDAIKLRKERNELLSDETGRRYNNKMLQDYQTEREKSRGENLFSLYFVIYMVTMIVLFALYMLTGLSDIDTHNIWLIASFVVPVLIVGIIAFIRKRLDKKHDDNYNPAKDTADGFKGRIREKYYAYEVEYRKLRGLYPAAQVKNQKEKESAAADNASDRSSIEFDTIDPKEDVICSKCAAKLTLNKDKRVYQCDHCGVAYGISLFFGLPMEKALNSLNTGYYSDADQRFAGILMVHPSDFEALLGRILCGGGWTKISDIDLTDHVDASGIKEIKERIADAKAHSSEENRAYFGNIETLVGYFEEYSANKIKIDKITGDVQRVEAGNAVMSEAFSGRDFKKKSESDRNEVIRKAYPFQVKNKKIEGDFRVLRRSVIEMRDDSVLCK